MNQKPLAEQRAFPSETESGYHPGMTLREHFAGLAMQSIITTTKQEGEITEEMWQRCFKLTASTAVKVADALLKELEK